MDMITDTIDPRSVVEAARRRANSANLVTRGDVKMCIPTVGGWVMR